jgi:hypothetical protein
VISKKSTLKEVLVVSLLANGRIILNTEVREQVNES